MLGLRLCPQRLAEILGCTRLPLRVALLLKESPGLLEAGDRPAVLTLPGQAAREVDECPCPIAQLHGNRPRLLILRNCLLVFALQIVIHSKAVQNIPQG